MQNKVYFKNPSCAFLKGTLLRERRKSSTSCSREDDFRAVCWFGCILLQNLWTSRFGGSHKSCLCLDSIFTVQKPFVSFNVKFKNSTYPFGEEIFPFFTILHASFILFQILTWNTSPIVFSIKNVAFLPCF